MDTDCNAIDKIIAEAIYRSENGLDGDTVATMLLDDFRIDGETVEECLEDVRMVCRSAAKTVQAALASGGYRIVPA